MSVIIAIDPGVSGGIAVQVFGVVDCQPMPPTGGDLHELLRRIQVAAANSGVVPVCYLECVGGFVGTGQPGSAMFKFGEGYGFIKGVIQTLGIRLVLVRPQVWQKVFGLGTASRCASKREWKNKLKAEAQRRFPELTVTLPTADALLILDWVRATQAITGEGAASTPHPNPLPDRGGEGEEGAARGDGGSATGNLLTLTRTALRSVPTTKISEARRVARDEGGVVPPHAKSISCRHVAGADSNQT